ncbi:MAG: ABC transporter permease [Methylobacteriaceae bacterium]|nr:ABC transporter permease [Methylobacteriaceae bacterium]
MSEQTFSSDEIDFEDEVVSEGRLSVKDGLAPLLTFMLLLLLWESCTRYFAIPSWLLPSPYEIGKSFIEWYDELWRHTLVTLYETLAGFALSIALAVPLAVLVVYSSFLRKCIYPLLLGLQSVPKVAIAPLLALWIGFGVLPKILVVFLVCFFPIIVATATGLSSVPPSVMELIRSLSASQLQTFIKIRFPTAIPHIFVGLKIAITFAVIGAVIGEFVGAESGLGYLILQSSSQSHTPVAFAALLVLTIMSIVLYYAIELIEKFIVPWATTE